VHYLYSVNKTFHSCVAEKRSTTLALQQSSAVVKEGQVMIAEELKVNKCATQINPLTLNRFAHILKVKKEI
jgi:hypothetical protein